MPSTDLVSLDAKTVTLHGAGRSDAHEVTLRKTDLSAVALGTAWHLPTATMATAVGTSTAIPLVLAHLVPRWTVQGAIVSLCLLLGSIFMFSAARRAELVVRAHNGDAAFRALYPPWRVDQCLDTFRALETAMGRHERHVPHPVDARIRILWSEGHPRPHVEPTMAPDIAPARTGRPVAGEPVRVAAPGELRQLGAPTKTLPRTTPPPPTIASPAERRGGNPWFEHILASTNQA